MHAILVLMLVPFCCPASFFAKVLLQIWFVNVPEA